MKLEFVDNLRLVVKGFRRKRRAVLLRQPASSPDAEADNAVPRRFDVSLSITELVKMVKGETLDEATMGITLKHIRSTALPGYVFDPGERDSRSTGKRAKQSLGGTARTHRPRVLLGAAVIEFD
ncbi:hypothetical protein C8F04DRAFT_1258388 [Mycena alexandri]|uniref:Poly(A) polymerase RNA-binding domain-containing protein n=1 Tax=Mycena alexandri TaxID=1745969 RepID=A0AAD6T1B5_9AGAR|nr:hypothetical protein C8F04DRAFT_1258388 [Mycena alexandri]